MMKKNIIIRSLFCLIICLVLNYTTNTEAVERECLAEKGCLGTCTYTVDGLYDFEDPDYYARVTLNVTYNVYNNEMKLSSIGERAGDGQSFMKDDDGDDPMPYVIIPYNKFPSTYSSNKNSCPNMYFGFSDDFSKIAVAKNAATAKSNANKKGCYSLAIEMNSAFNGGSVSSNLNESEVCQIPLYKKNSNGNFEFDENGKIIGETRDVSVRRNDSENSIISVHIETTKGVTCSTSPGGSCTNIASKFINSSTLMIECPNDLAIIENQHGEVTLATKAQIEAYEKAGVDVTTSDDPYIIGGTIDFPTINLNTEKITCESLGEVVNDIQMIYNLLKVVVVFLLILFCSLDFAKAVMSQDNDLLKKATNSAIKRVIAAILFLFLPTILNIILPLAGLDNPLCGIR